MKVSLNKDHDCKKNIEELDDLIKDAVSLFSGVTTTGCLTSGINIMKMDHLQEIILNYLLNKTNFQSCLSSIKTGYGTVKYGTRTILSDVLCRIRRKKTDPSFGNFLKELNKKLRETKNKPIRKYNYYIPSWIFLRLEDDKIKTIQKKIHRFCNIRFKSPSKTLVEKINNPTVRSFFARFSERSYINVDVSARDQFFAGKVVDDRISSLLGLFSFVENEGKHPTIYISLSWGMSIDRPPIEEKLFILAENNRKILYPREDIIRFLEYDIKDHKIKRRPTWNIHNGERGNYEKIIKCLDSINKNSKSVNRLLEQSFKLYYEACIEQNLEMSFLKFWVLAETILKQGRQRDKKFKSTLRSLIRERHLRAMIDILYEKRNELVHEFKTDYISQNDRNLAKALAEVSIWFLINPPRKINNLEEFKTMVDNITLSKEELKTRRNIINSIIKLK